MNKILSKFYSFVERIGKRNAILIVFIIIVLLVTGLYQTFSLYTEGNGVSIIDGLKTYKFILGEDRENSVTIAAGTSKNLAITISNHDKINLKYGIYYSSSDDLTDVSIGYLESSDYPASGTIFDNQDYIVTIKVVNHSNHDVTLKFGISYGLENGGELILETGKTWVQRYSQLATQYIKDLYGDGSNLRTIHIGGDLSKPIVTQNAIQGIMLDNNGEYRYYGANPDNYVTFNGELWRIISVSNVKSSPSDTIGSIRMKIIRNESVGTYSWDSSISTINSGYGVNDWRQADLNVELNTLYYNQQSGTCYNGDNNASTTCDFLVIGLSNETKKMIDDALWYLGGSNSDVGMYANDYYMLERGSAVYDCRTDDGACPRATTWVGKVGLMYPSDYVYATDQDLCTVTTHSWNSICTMNNWLFNKNSQWFLFPHSGLSYAGFYTYLNGNVHGSNASNPFSVRPVVILQSDVLINGGEGTDTSPYQLLVE